MCGCDCQFQGNRWMDNIYRTHSNNRCIIWAKEAIKLRAFSYTHMFTIVYMLVLHPSNLIYWENWKLRPERIRWSLTCILLLFAVQFSSEQLSVVRNPARMLLTLEQWVLCNPSRKVNQKRGWSISRKNFISFPFKLRVHATSSTGYISCSECLVFCGVYMSGSSSFEFGDLSLMNIDKLCGAFVTLMRTFMTLN